MKDDISREIIKTIEETREWINRIESAFIEAIKEVGDRSLAVEEILVYLSLEVIEINKEKTYQPTQKENIDYLEFCYKEDSYIRDENNQT